MQVLPPCEIISSFLLRRREGDGYFFFCVDHLLGVLFSPERRDETRELCRLVFFPLLVEVKGGCILFLPLPPFLYTGCSILLLPLNPRLEYNPSFAIL